MRSGVVAAALGAAPTLALGSSYYLPTIPADPIAAGLAFATLLKLCPKAAAAVAIAR